MSRGIVAALFAGIASAQALDDGKYPDWKGQWSRERMPIPGGG